MKQVFFESDSRRVGACGTRRFFTPLAVAVALVLVTPVSASADGIDILWLITRVGRIHPVLTAAIMVGLMLINYLLNLLVLGKPAARFLQIEPGALTKDLVVFTLLAQITDRACGVIAFFLGLSVIGFTSLRGEQELVAGLLVGVYLNFIFSGAAVGLLAVWYLRRRWRIEPRRANAIALWTAVITNPAWAMMIQWFIARRSPF